MCGIIIIIIIIIIVKKKRRIAIHHPTAVGVMCRCHGNGQNAKKLKNTKRIIAGYSPNRN
jgi:hypothetical protein